MLPLHVNACLVVFFLVQHSDLGGWVRVVGFRGGSGWGFWWGSGGGHSDVRLSSTFFVINAWFESGLIGARAYACSGSLLWCFPVVKTQKMLEKSVVQKF